MLELHANSISYICTVCVVFHWLKRVSFFCSTFFLLSRELFANIFRRRERAGGPKANTNFTAHYFNAQLSFSIADLSIPRINPTIALSLSSLEKKEEKNSKNHCFYHYSVCIYFFSRTWTVQKKRNKLTCVLKLSSKIFVNFKSPLQYVRPYWNADDCRFAYSTTASSTTKLRQNRVELNSPLSCVCVFSDLQVSQLLTIVFSSSVETVQRYTSPFCLPLSRSIFLALHLRNRLIHHSIHVQI